MGVGRMHKGTHVDNSSESSSKMDDLNTGKSSLTSTIETNYYVPKMDTKKKMRLASFQRYQIFCSPKLQRALAKATPNKN